MYRDSDFDIPVAMIVYKRLDVTKQSFECIRKVKPKKLYIISDGAKTENDTEAVDAVRNYIEANIDWECELYKDYATHNYGLRYRMPSGMKWVFEREDKAIFVEDDICPTESFFWFCKEMLEKYENDERIMMISGTNLYSDCNEFGEYDITFSFFSSIWGWATWKRAFEKYDVNIRKWPEYRKSKKMKSLIDKNTYRTYAMIFNDLQFQWYGTWDYQWEFARLSNMGLGIIPKYNLIRNIGMGDINGEHPDDSEDRISFMNSLNVKDMEFPVRCPEKCEINKQYDHYYQERNFESQSSYKFVKSILRAKLYEMFLRQIRNMEKNKTYYDNILPNKYKLIDWEKELNVGELTKTLTSKDLIKCWKAYMLYKLFRVNCWTKEN